MLADPVDAESDTRLLRRLASAREIGDKDAQTWLMINLFPYLPKTSQYLFVRKYLRSLYRIEYKNDVQVVWET